MRLLVGRSRRIPILAPAARREFRLIRLDGFARRIHPQAGPRATHVEDGLDGTRGHAGATVDALVRVDDEEVGPVPEAVDGQTPEHPPLRVSAAQVTWLEDRVDEVNEPLDPLTSFVLPGGTPASAWLHLARTVCRRTEISVWALKENEPINDQVVCYLNRLSDLLFVLAQHCNDLGKFSILWVPGANRES